MSREEEGQKEGLSGAMKIFEALSSADEELLTRSENHKGNEGHKRVISFGRFAKVMAACICFAVLGVAAYTGTQLHTAKENMSADCASPADVKEAVEGVSIDEAAPEAAEGVAMDEVTEVVGGAVAEEALEMEADAGASLAMSDEAWEEEALRATEILGAYLPTWLPEGYVYESGCGVDENHSEQGISLQWTNGVDTIRISVRECVPEQALLQSQYPVFVESSFAPENVRACIRSAGEEGDANTPAIHFAVLYDSGILVEYCGDATAEDIWKMFESVALEEK